jgi:hypothetical protein
MRRRQVPEPPKPERDPALDPEPEAVELLTRLVMALPERLEDWRDRSYSYFRLHPAVAVFTDVIGMGSGYEGVARVWPDRELALSWLLDPYKSLSGPGQPDPYGRRVSGSSQYLWPSKRRAEEQRRAVAAAERVLREYGPRPPR